MEASLKMYNPASFGILDHIDKSFDQLIEDVGKYPPREKAKLSAFIWFRLCDHVPPEDVACLKSNISYDLTNDMTIFEVQDLLIDYGFNPDYVNEQTKSTINESYRRSKVGRK